MPRLLRRPWTADDIAKLKAMAQKYPAAHIAAELGRGLPATRVKAHQLQISLSRNYARQPTSGLGGTELRD
jgi:hypothetical protein